MRSISMSMLKVLHIKSPKILTKSRKSWNHFQNKEKGGLEVLREFGHNEEEEHANEDPGVNSDNEEDDEFKVWQTRLHLLKSCWIHNLDRPLLYSSSRRSASPVQRLQSAEEKANLQPELNQKLPPLHLRGPARCPAQTPRGRWASRGRLPEGREWRKTRSGMLSFWESQVETRISVFFARIIRKVFLFESDL